MNVEADEAAGEFRRKFGKYLPTTPILPACPAVLSLRGRSITNNYKGHLTRAYTEPTYIEFLMDKFDWGEDAVQMIAWKCLSLAF